MTKNIFKIIFQLMVIWIPWPLRRRILNLFFNFHIHPTAKIGISLIIPLQLEMAENSRIHNFVICKAIDRLILKEDSGIANFTFITGFNTKNFKTFSHVKNRKCELVVGKSAGITNRHYIDCNGGVYIGDFTTIAGLQTQILTHSIDIYKNRQNAESVIIGKYCFVGTNCIVLPGSHLPDYCVLGAGSVLKSKFENKYILYAGNPAVQKKEIDKKTTMYFHRDKHYVD